MGENNTDKQFLSLDGLKIYDAQIKKYSDNADAAVAAAAKAYTDKAISNATFSTIINWGALGED